MSIEKNKVDDTYKKFNDGRFRLCQELRTTVFYFKQQEDLDKLRELGISMIYMGLESGNDEVLTYMKKGEVKCWKRIFRNRLMY